MTKKEKIIGAVVGGLALLSLWPRGNTASAATSQASDSNRLTVYFGHDSSQLNAQSRDMLRALAARVRESGASLLVVGHASPSGSAAYNSRLAEDRAMTVRSFLVNSGVPSARVSVDSKGESEPAGSEAASRRVEIYVE